MASACARTAIAGNPSDGYGGAVLAVTFQNFKAHVHATASERSHSDPPSALVDAAQKRLGPGGALLSWRNDVPQAVGLGSSSALIVAALRALCELNGGELGPTELARLAHRVEREDLAIPGGRQDQVVQAHGGLMFMDFGAERFERLDPALLPPLLVAYLQHAAEDSGLAHAPLRARMDRGDSAAVSVLGELAATALDARDALLARDHRRLALAVDATFDARTRLMELDPRHVAMVQCARAAGAAANFSGSGGAIVCVCEDDAHRRQVGEALAQLGAQTLVPQLI